MNPRSFALYVCWIMLFFPLFIQGQDSTAWASEKMMAIQKAEENQRLNRLSYPEHLFESEVWQPPGNEELPSKTIPIWAYSLGMLFLVSLTFIAVKVHIRNRQNTQKQKLIWDKVASLKSQIHSDTETEKWVPIGKQVLEELNWEVLQKTSIQLQLSSTDNFLQLVFSLEKGGNSTELSLALSQVLEEKAGSTLQIQKTHDEQLSYLFSIPHHTISSQTEGSHADLATINSSDSTIKSVDQDFLSRVNELVVEKMGDADFNAEAFREEMGMSKTHFYRKLQELTQQSPGQYIRNMRLNKARQLLEAGTGNVSEVAYEVGFNNLSYFSRCFRNEFGILPSEVS